MMIKGRMRAYRSLEKIENVIHRKGLKSAIGMVVAGIVLIVPATWVQPAATAFFEKKIRPVLSEHCYECHSVSVGKNKGELILDTAEGLREGGESGPMIVPGNPEASLIFQKINHREPDERMPPEYRLDGNIIADFRQWIESGAAMPEQNTSNRVGMGTENESENGYSGKAYPDSWDDHWAYQPIRNPSVPQTKTETTGRNAVDRFIVHRLEEVGLRMSKRASWPRLIRRLHLDVTGLPPDSGEVENFMRVPSMAAYERLVEELLSREAFGEHWARMWLDVARYADSNGSDENLYFANAWRYRNYVIRSFNKDKPIDRFICEQLAGDFLQNQNHDRFDPDLVTATGFLNLGPRLVAEQDKEKMLMDLADEQMDVTGQAFLGISIGCARCHDHKFDPFTHEDYYAMAGIFRSTKSMGNLDFVSHWLEKPLASKSAIEHRQNLIAQLESIDKSLAQARKNALMNLGHHLRSNTPSHLAKALEYRTNANRQKSDNPGIIGWIKRLDEIEEEKSSHLRELLEMSRLYPWTQLENINSSELMARSTQFHERLIRTVENSEVTGDRVLDGAAGTAFQSSEKSAFDIPHHTGLESERISVTAWVKVDSGTAGNKDTRRWIVSKNLNEWEDGHYAIGLQEMTPIAYLNIGGGRNNSLLLRKENIKLKKGAWHHLALTAGDTEAVLYVDGKVVDTHALPRPRTTTATGHLSVGKRPDSYNYFDGYIDEAAVFDVALEKEAIEKLSQRGTLISEIREWKPVWYEGFNLPDDRMKHLLRARGTLELLTAEGGPWHVAEEGDNQYLLPDDERILTELRDRKAELSSRIPGEVGTAMSVEDMTPVNLKIHVRGSHLNLKGEPVRRRMPMEHMGIAAREIPESASGRLQLAHWITDRANPLTARVFVNRLWQGCFGEGLVRTPNNFGRRGADPTHPELLDWLATRFMEDGWSMKELLKTLLTSATYMQDSRPQPDAMELDPDNRLLWRMSPRRMTIEQIRDSLMVVSGLLDHQFAAGANATKNFNYVPGGDFFRKVSESDLRTIYMPVIRDRVHPDLEIFDFANPGVSTGRRQVTTVPLQSLYFLNNGKVRQWAERIAADAGASPSPIDHIYLGLLGRRPRIDERQLFDSMPGTSLIEITLALIASNEFIYRL